MKVFLIVIVLEDIYVVFYWYFFIYILSYMVVGKVFIVKSCYKVERERVIKYNVQNKRDLIQYICIELDKEWSKIKQIGLQGIICQVIE